MKGCTLCPRCCGVDRGHTLGFCQAGNVPTVARAARHYGEEPPLSGTRGSGTVFFTGCSLGCSFCQNGVISRGRIKGKPFSPEALSDLFFTLVAEGAHNINLVTPSHFIPGIAAALRHKTLPIPVVYNCGGYEKVESLKQLEGLVDLYLPDYKYAESSLALALSGSTDYCEVVLLAVKEMCRQQPKYKLDAQGILQKGVLIRHLILPLHTRNSLAVLNAINENFPGVPVSLMAQYTPMGKSIPQFPELSRKITQRELKKVADEMLRLGITGFVQERSSAGRDGIPDFTKI